MSQRAVTVYMCIWIDVGSSPQRIFNFVRRGCHDDQLDGSVRFKSDISLTTQLFQAWSLCLPMINYALPIYIFRTEIDVSSTRSGMKLENRGVKHQADEYNCCCCCCNRRSETDYYWRPLQFSVQMVYYWLTRHVIQAIDIHTLRNALP